jgi:SAM-dependent methyltransferase
MLAGLELGVFTALSAGPATVTEVAGRLGVEADRLSPLLYALVVAGLLTSRDGCFDNTTESSAFLVKGAPRSLAGVESTWSDVWQANLRTAASIRTGRPQAAHDFAAMSPDLSAAFLRGLFPAGRVLGHALAEQYDFSASRSVVDIGGGSGGVLVGLCERLPKLAGTLFDLPSVVPFAAALIDETPYAERITVEAGDIVAAPPHGQFDAAILCAIVQLLAPDQAAVAIRHACSVLVPGGTIYISGRGILDDSRLAPSAGVFTNLTLLNFYEHGRAYTETEYFAWLIACGCVAPERIVLADGLQVIRARRDEVR